MQTLNRTIPAALPRIILFLADKRRRTSEELNAINAVPGQALDTFFWKGSLDFVFESLAGKS